MIRLAVTVTREQAEVALADLLALAPAGVEEVDGGAAVVEYVLYGAAEELPSEAAVSTAVGDALISIASSEIADDWSQRWREFHRELRLGGRLVVRPPWIAASETEIDLVIDPGQAFGTGAHPTTALCLELLLEMEVPTPLIQVNSPGLIDLGCGSGVLAILAARLGWQNVLGLDFDPLAVTATRENAAVNGVSLWDVRRFDLLQEDVPIAPVVLANLLAPLLLGWCQRMAAPGAVKRPREIVASGLLASEADDVGVAFCELGYELRERRFRGDWAALWFSTEVL